jgi:glycosyltransferase involved in cell wall biosynthesis
MADIGAELVSVVVPTRNRRARLERALESVDRQTWPNIETIVVDDASNDDTPQFLQRLVDSGASIRVVRNAVPLGGAGARNRGIEVASGVYAAFLDDDDIWLPEKLQSQIALLKEHPSALSVSCDFCVQHSSGRRTVTHLTPPASSQQILHTNHLGGASMCLTTRQMLLDIGGFDAGLRSCQDWDLWIKLNDRGPVLVCRETLVCYMPDAEVRITSNPVSTYLGRRRIFLRYKSRMTVETRAHHLGELLYCRQVLLESSPIRRVCGLATLVGFAGWYKGPRYIYRYLKQVLQATL